VSQLLNRLKKISQSLVAQNSTLDEEVEATAKDLRLHARYRLNDDEATFTIGGTNTPWRINNISYSGLAGSIIDPAQGPLTIESHFEGKLTFLDRQQSCQLTRIRTFEKEGKVVFWGAEFQHLGPEMLVFLRGFLEPWRWGQTLVLVPPEFRADRYKGDSWYCFRGDGPTDLIFHHLPGREGQEVLTTVLLTFLINGRYGELRWKDTVLTTSLASDSESKAFQVGATMEALPTLDTDLLRTGLCILSALEQSHRHPLKPFIHEVRRLLDLSTAG
jgi:hypothetical protein